MATQLEFRAEILPSGFWFLGDPQDGKGGAGVELPQAATKECLFSEMPLPSLKGTEYSFIF